MKTQAINLGRVGILLPIATIIPFLGTVAGLAVMVLLLFSHHYFSKAFEKPDIFKNALTGTIVIVVANIIGGIIIAIGVGSAAVSMSSGEMDPGNIQKMIGMVFESGLTIVGGIIILIGIIFGYYYIFQALKSLAEQSGVKLFRTAGLLYFIGAIGVIVFGLGFLLMFVAWIIHVVAYFSIHAEKEVV